MFEDKEWFQVLRADTIEIHTASYIICLTTKS